MTQKTAITLFKLIRRSLISVPTESTYATRMTPWESLFHSFAIQILKKFRLTNVSLWHLCLNSFKKWLESGCNISQFKEIYWSQYTFFAGKYLDSLHSAWSLNTVFCVPRRKSQVSSVWPHMEASWIRWLAMLPFVVPFRDMLYRCADSMAIQSLDAVLEICPHVSIILRSILSIWWTNNDNDYADTGLWTFVLYVFTAIGQLIFTKIHLIRI